ncbi:alpha-ketoglutarate-dependent dioxygenase AlkB [Pseudomonas sp. PA1(2017)]|uniref:alpha-ketoglutarate-dependent dioxygenase AlkB n=1 Tax=Pseudomonas sp. PA1(2017) TaxID=1932113 RepID=UPI0009661EE9|nr:alpha-ketoglutarate-dependent dioxygenase AlkB [Pseudomonas sp. PA1(2017)]OLU20638.1 alpha-ketoglutarate-dependent dioxygenase AlkB [Pseudomonas sp. PA1(2017)]
MERPPIYLKSKFISYPRELFTFLRDSITWDERMRARKTASFGVSYNYSQISYEQVKMLPELESICELIELELGFRPNNCLLNYYLDENSSMGFHSDSSEELAKGTGVAIVSLGAVREIAYRSKLEPVVEFFCPLESGSLLYMSQEMQELWLHAIPKVGASGERISLTFRQIIK